jgi:hypothetical protein
MVRKKRENDLIKATIEKQITRSMTNKLSSKNSKQAIAAINNLIFPELSKSKLKS